MITNPGRWVAYAPPGSTRTFSMPSSPPVAGSMISSARAVNGSATPALLRHLNSRGVEASAMPRRPSTSVRGPIGVTPGRSVNARSNPATTLGGRGPTA